VQTMDQILSLIGQYGYLVVFFGVVLESVGVPLPGETILIAAGWSFSLALKDDGTVWAWGANQVGQLGDGTSTDGTLTTCEYTVMGGGRMISSCTDSNTPVQMSEVGGIEVIAAGGVHGLALKDDGTVWAWGANERGQLGNGTYTLGTSTAGINTPVQVGNLSAVKAIAGGGQHSLAGW
jgi:alpha-tubulin suppressor-like RCC1 family protein